MTTQEYSHIITLSLDLLIEAKIEKLPVDIYSIAKLYNLESLVDFSKSRYRNALRVSKRILKIYGYKNDGERTHHLAVKILSPMIVLKALDLKSAEELRKLTGLPYLYADFRFSFYKRFPDLNEYKTINAERRVLSQFQDWINVVENR